MTLYGPQHKEQNLFSTEKTKQNKTSIWINQTGGKALMTTLNLSTLTCVQ